MIIIMIIMIIRTNNKKKFKRKWMYQDTPGSYKENMNNLEND